jgi:uncharacterized protein (TIGR02147 family)
MNIFEQDSYKQIIRYLGKDGPKAVKGFYRKLSEHLGTHPTYVSQVLSGPKDFTEDQVVFTCDFLGLEEKEIQYILTVHKIERAGSKRIKDLYEKELAVLRKDSILKGRFETEKSLTEIQLSKLYSDWAHSAVHMMSTLEKKPDILAIEKRLNLSRQQTQSILKFLIAAGLVVEKNNKFHEGSSRTVLAKNSPHLLQHHTHWRLKAIDKFARKSENELMFTSNFSLSYHDFSRLRKQTLEFIQNFMETVDKSPAEDIAFLNLDLLWV